MWRIYLLKEPTENRKIILLFRPLKFRQRTQNGTSTKFHILAFLCVDQTKIHGMHKIEILWLIFHYISFWNLMQCILSEGFWIYSTRTNTNWLSVQSGATTATKSVWPRSSQQSSSSSFCIWRMKICRRCSSCARIQMLLWAADSPILEI